MNAGNQATGMPKRVAKGLYSTLKIKSGKEKRALHCKARFNACYDNTLFSRMLFSRR